MSPYFLISWDEAASQFQKQDSDLDPPLKPAKVQLLSLETYFFSNFHLKLDNNLEIWWGLSQWNFKFSS